MIRLIAAESHKRYLISNAGKPGMGDINALIISAELARSGQTHISSPSFRAMYGLISIRTPRIPN